MSVEVLNSTGAEAHATLGLSPTKEHASSPAEELDVTETESSDSPEELNLTETNMVNGEDWNHITKPGTHDVLLGRGGGTNNHAGNIKFRKLVNEHKMRYLACSKVDKPKVARQVVALWRKLDPPGRFLARQDESKRGPGSVKSQDNVWYEVGDKKAREKASQCLRERTPDVIPYIKHLRDQQNAITEQGVSFVQMQMQQQQEQQFHGVPSMHHPHAMPHHRAMSFPGFDPQQHSSSSNSIRCTPTVPPFIIRNNSNKCTTPLQVDATPCRPHRPSSFPRTIFAPLFPPTHRAWEAFHQARRRHP